MTTEIGKYRHLPTEIRAVQWTGDNLDQVKLVAGAHNVFYNQHGLYIRTNHGLVHVDVNAYVSKGEFDVYPIGPEVIERNYERIDGEVEGQLTLPGM